MFDKFPLRWRYSRQRTFSRLRSIRLRAPEQRLSSDHRKKRACMSDLLDAPYSVSARAAKRIAAILKKEPEGSMLRVAVNGGGCSGFQYDFEITTERNGDDIAVTRDGVTVLVDEMSLEFMKGSEIDFADEIIGAAFRINNPNATANCGCGTSFSV